ncbi:MAG: type I glyceraldehyde-3-phosphate dehydrogenase, partial [Deltaproteobacteria bacterium]|nr:type I glyceraldehyde-3-phosphate dehydrogenase [Deltaproteobacteria bacterium]
MALRIGINGFGRIGRTIFRLAQGDPQFEVVKINDLAPMTELAHLLKYDSVHGNFKGTVETQENALVVDGRKVLVSKIPDITKINWSDTPVDIVLECTGRLEGKKDCIHHLKGGA